GPVLGGIINQNLGWQFIFFVLVPIGFAIIILALLKLKGEWAGARGEKYDLAGAILYTVGLSSFMYAVSSISNSPTAKYIMLSGLVILIIFIAFETRIASPIINLNLFSKNIGFAFSNLAALINYSATAAVGFLLSVYLQVIMGFDSQTAGLILLSQPVIMSLLSPFAGNLSDHIEPRIVASAGMALTTLGLFLLIFLSMDTPVWFTIATLMLLGMGFALFSSPNSNAVMASVEKKFYGIASSTLGTMRLTGQALSMAIVTMIIALFVGNVELSPAYADSIMKSMKVSFIIFTAICFGGVFASLARGNINNLPATDEAKK
ncbi:MAG: MFS transporter, partial [Firmicutes bacterium]|nr:MFS transporter [Bacillota bacterium]